MRYHGTVIRPPSEADSLIIQVTYGCSHNSCDFCGTYLDKPFRVRPFQEVVEDVRRLPDELKSTVTKVFLGDGDAVILPRRRLRELLELLHEELPSLQRVSSYASAQALLKKDVEDLRPLKDLGLTLLYLGLESGDDATLRSCNKGVTVAAQIEACSRASEAGMQLSVTTVLGLAGEERALEHARATGRALSAIDPEYIGVLSLMVVEGTGLAERVRRGEFKVPGSWAMLRELRELIDATQVSGALFRSNHASNYLPLGGRLPEDKARLLAALAEALQKKRARVCVRRPGGRCRSHSPSRPSPSWCRETSSAATLAPGIFHPGRWSLECRPHNPRGCHAPAGRPAARESILLGDEAPLSRWGKLKRMTIAVLRSASPSATAFRRGWLRSFAAPWARISPGV